MSLPAPHGAPPAAAAESEPASVSPVCRALYGELLCRLAERRLAERTLAAPEAPPPGTFEAGTTELLERMAALSGPSAALEAGFAAYLEMLAAPIRFFGPAPASLTIPPPAEPSPGSASSSAAAAPPAAPTSPAAPPAPFSAQPGQVICSALASSMSAWRSQAGSLEKIDQRFPGLLTLPPPAPTLTEANPTEWSADWEPARPKPPAERIRATFDSFVSSEGNARAFQLCVRIAEFGVAAPLLAVLHGSRGVGKTHLLEAVAQGVTQLPVTRPWPGPYAGGWGRACGPALYLTGRGLAEDYLRHERECAVEAFTTACLGASILVVDDIHGLAREPRVQTALADILRRRLAEGAPVLLACPQPPWEISGFHLDLVHRLQCAETQELAPPPPETRREILHRRAEILGIPPEAGIPALLAGRFASDLRGAMEALRRLGAVLAGRPAHALPPRQALRALLAGFPGADRPAIELERIRETVSRHFGLRAADLSGRRRLASIALARQVAMFLARENTTRSLREIGEFFGNRDAATVLHGWRRIRDDERSLRVARTLEEDLLS